MGRYHGITIALGVTAALVACEDSPIDVDSTDVVLADHSSTPALLKNLATGLQVYSLIGSDDDLPLSPGYVFGGSADGAGILTNPDGTFTILVNHEDNFSVSRVTLDETFKPVRGEYLLNSNQGQWRLCSASMATLEGHGFGPTFLTVGESSIESMIHAVNPMGAPGSASRVLPALGKWNSENAVPLPKEAYANRTVILIGDDDSGANGGQVVLYVGNSLGDLDGGSLYVMARNDNNQRERDMVVGQSYPVTFKQLTNQASKTGAQLDAEAVALGAIKFGRVEDLDYRKGIGGGREIYFNVTGQMNSGVNADNSRSKYGRVYRLALSPASPTSGTLELVMDGDDRAGPAGQFQNPDNITVTQNYVYVAEDPNGYGDETHDARIYQYNIATRAMSIMMELDHKRSDPKYNVGGSSAFGSWEFGAMIDISDDIGIGDTFLIAIQPHTWRGTRYVNPDKGTIRPAENQASQLVVVKGIPR